MANDGRIYDLDNNYTTLNNVLLDIEKDTLSHYAKDLLIQYKKYAGENGRVYPSVKTLAAKVICSDRSIQAAKKELKEKGYLLCFNRYNNNPDDKLYKQQLSSIIVLLPLDENGKPKKLDDIYLEELTKKVINHEQNIDKNIICKLENTHVKDLRKTKPKKKSINIPGECNAPGEGALHSPGKVVNLMHRGGESPAPKKYDNKSNILEEEEDDDDAFKQILQVFRDNIDEFKITPTSKKLEFVKLIYTKYGYNYLDKLIELCCDYNTNNPYGYFKKVTQTFIINKIDTVEKLQEAINNWQEINTKLKAKEREVRKRKLNYGQIKEKGHFNDYEQRDYDFDDLEKKLLGWEETM